MFPEFISYSSEHLSSFVENLKKQRQTAVLNKVLCDFLLAGLAEANEFKQVTIYSKSCPLGEALLRFLQSTTGEINDFAAVRTNQVMMMPWSTNCVATATISGV